MEGLFDKETLSRNLNEGASCPYLGKEAAGAKIPRLRLFAGGRSSKRPL